MNQRTLSIIAGVSYLVIFFLAIYANFFVLDAILQDPLGTIEQNSMHVRFGALAFLVAAVFDVIVAWALYELYKGNILSRLSTYFRIIHAVIMGVAVFALPLTLTLTADEAILNQVTIFNTMWLIGLFFFGVHLILLGRIVKHIRIIPWILMLAGVMYIVDTGAHFLLPHYETYADLFLMAVAIPAIFGEMSFSLWLLFKGEKSTASN
ncbi:MAG: DUF4386 domain-containing protein [Patescibacteria group bacterium UBA2163]